MSKVAVVKISEIPDNGRLSREQYAVLLKRCFDLKSGGVDFDLSRMVENKRIGIKTNCLTRKFLSTSTALISALVDLLTQNGTDENDIIVWDRTNRELEGAGYKLNASSSGVRFLGTDTNGVGYSQEFYSYGKVSSLVSRILDDMVDINLNLPVLKDHSIAGLSGGLKNMYGAIHNPNKYHADNCDPFVADANGLAPIKAKYRLTIIDAARVQYNMGPGYDSRYILNYGGLIVSDDPVAADSVGLDLIESLRKKNGLKSLAEVGREVRYLATAEKNGLGTADPEKIDLKVLTVNSDGAVISKDGDLYG